MNEPLYMPLLAYSEGRLSRQEAVRLTGVRDYAELLVMLGDAGLSLPMPPGDQVAREVEIVRQLWAVPERD